MIPNIWATSIASPLKVEVWNIIRQYLEVRSNAQSILLQTSHSEWIPIIQYLHFRNSLREVAIATGYPKFGVASFDSLQHIRYWDFVLQAKSQRWLPIRRSLLSAGTLVLLAHHSPTQSQVGNKCLPYSRSWKDCQHLQVLDFGILLGAVAQLPSNKIKRFHTISCSVTPTTQE